MPVQRQNNVKTLHWHWYDVVRIVAMLRARWDLATCKYFSIQYSYLLHYVSLTKAVIYMFLSGIRKILLWHKIKCWEIATFEYLVYGNKESNILDNRFF